MFLRRCPKKWGILVVETDFCLEPEEGRTGEKCLALEDTFESRYFLNRCLHNFFSVLCLPECDNVELSGYAVCFYKSGYVAELLDRALNRVVLYVQQGYAEGHLALWLSVGLNSVESCVCIGRSDVCNFTYLLDCLVDLCWASLF